MKALLPVLSILLGCNFSAGKTYQLEGTVLEVQERSIVIDHEAIPDFMEAKVMSFNADPNLLKGLKAGNRIAANLLVSEDSSQLIGIEVIDQAVLP